MTIRSRVSEEGVKDVTGEVQEDAGRCLNSTTTSRRLPVAAALRGRDADAPIENTTKRDAAVPIIDHVTLE